MSSTPTFDSHPVHPTGGTTWGIGAKLLAAFALVAALAIAASAVAFKSYKDISRDLGAIGMNSLPGMTHALILARQAAGLAAA